MQKLILIADDDSHIREVVQFALEKAGMNVIAAGNGVEALELFKTKKPSLVILDVNMPEMDGLETCKAIRKIDSTPILFLSAKDEEIDKVIGLEIGGDDYVAKPFSPRELVARVNVILKRSGNIHTDNKKVFTKGEIELNIESHIVSFKNKPISLTATEFSLLATLLKHQEKVYSRDELMNDSYDNIVVSDRTIDSHIRHLRTKFAEAGAADVVTTIHGVGYKLGSCK